MFNNINYKKNSFLVCGEPGVGKSFFIRKEAQNHNAKLFRWNVRIDRSLREGRETLHQQVRSKEPMYIWIEGADDLTQEAQAFLRRILETASSSVTSMLEIREPWKLSPPILSRCILININTTKSFRSMKNIQMANKFNLIPSLPLIDIKNLKVNSIYNLRKMGYDPLEIIENYSKTINDDNKCILEIYKKIGAGFSPWIILAYIIQLNAVYEETKDKTN
jgi:hypothetical protein